MKVPDRLLPIRARWRRVERSGQEWVVVLVVGLLIASILAGLTTTEEVGWRQLTTFGLVMTFYALLALGLSLEFGYTGLLNLGHIGFAALGAYSYGVLMMAPTGRPVDPAPIVGWMYDRTSAFEGTGVGGLLACTFTGLLAAALVLIPLLLMLESGARREPGEPSLLRRLALRVLLLAGGAAALWAGFAGKPAGKPAFVAGLLLFLVFAGFLAIVAGTLLLVRTLVGMAVRGTALRGSGGARAAVGVVAAIAVGVWVFFAGYPLGEEGARSMGVLFSVLIGLAVAALAALLLGLPAIRLREDYLAIVTLGFAEILRSVLLNEEAWTRGAQPISSFPRPVATWVAENEWYRDWARDVGIRPGDLALLVVSALILAYAYVLLRALSDSPWGRVLKSIREDEEAAAALGKNVTWFKLQSLMLGSALAALAGVLLVSQQALILHSQFMPIVTFYAFIIIVMGGIGSHRGALIGAVLLWGIFYWAQNAGLEAFKVDAGPPQLMVVGAVLILIMMFRPQGLVGRREELLFAK